MRVSATRLNIGQALLDLARRDLPALRTWLRQISSPPSGWWGTSVISCTHSRDEDERYCAALPTYRTGFTWTVINVQRKIQERVQVKTSPVLRNN